MEIINNNPIQNSLVPFETIDSLTDIQKDCVDAILNEFMIKADLIKPNQFAASLDTWGFKDAKNDPVCAFLDRMVTIVFTILPEKKFNHKYVDFTLEQEFDGIVYKINENKTQLTNWFNELNTSLAVFKTTTPHPKPYKEQLDTIGQTCADIFEEIRKDKEQFSLNVKERLRNDGTRQTSLDSLQLMVDAHDNDMKYLTTNIAYYRDLIPYLKGRETGLDNNIRVMTKVKSAMETPFNDLKYKTGHDKGLEKFTPNLKPKISPQLAPIKVKDLTDEQKGYVLQLFDILSAQDLNPTKFEPLVFIGCKDPVFAPLLNMVSLWTPCRNNLKLQVYKNFHDEIHGLNGLIAEINKAIAVFDNWTTQLDTKITNFKKHTNVHDDRNEYLKSFMQMSSTALKKITETMLSILINIKTKLGEGKRKDIHSVSKDLICCSVDITESDVTKNIKSLLDARVMGDCIAEYINKMNASMDTFKRSFNLFNFFFLDVSYEGVDLEGFAAFCDKQEKKFNRWYPWGYYDYINQDQVKKPSNAQELNEL